jgi:hypothetical protein
MENASLDEARPPLTISALAEIAHSGRYIQ